MEAARADRALCGHFFIGFIIHPDRNLSHLTIIAVKVIIIIIIIIIIVIYIMQLPSLLSEELDLLNQLGPIPRVVTQLVIFLLVI